MDQDQSSNPLPKPLADQAEGDAEADPSRPEHRAQPDTESQSLLGRLLGWSGNGADLDADAPEADRLGSAFRNSSAAELAMVHNILRLRDLRVEDVMTPRADIVGVDENASLDEILQASETGSHSRLPVYRETLDDPIGFVHMKDLALRHGFSRAGAKPFRLTDHIRTALFVPPSMRIASLLQKMQGERVHMALVIDEFGGVDGLVTIEDLVEQIVGDIEDEHDREGADPWISEGPETWLVQARADIREFQEAEGLNLLLEDWEEDVDTLGGLVFMLANRVPMRGEVIVHPAGYEFEIVDAEPRRIKRLRLRNGNGRSALSQAAE
ncbi:MAG: hemolysin family protein [Pseudomonadota bacterium]